MLCEAMVESSGQGFLDIGASVIDEHIKHILVVVIGAMGG